MDLNKPDAHAARFIVWFAVWWTLIFLFRFSPYSTPKAEMSSSALVLTGLTEWVIFFVLYYKFVK